MLLQYILCIVIALGIIALLCIAYEWIRYESGWIKPPFTEEECESHIRVLNEIIKSTDNDSVLTNNIQYRDELSYWKAELDKIKIWQQKHS